MIIGRHKQKAILTRISESQQAEFIVVYGRRRVGKTYLIESFSNFHSLKYSRYQFTNDLTPSSILVEG